MAVASLGISSSSALPPHKGTTRNSSMVLGSVPPQPKRPTVAHPRGRVSVVKDVDLPPLSPAPSVASSPHAYVSTATASVPAPAATDAAASVPASAASVGLATSIAPLAPGCDATVLAPLPARSSHDNVHVACDNEAPYDPMLHRDVSDAMEDLLDVPNGCTLFSDLDGMVQSAGLDDVVDEATDALIRDVASSILGQVLASIATPATVVSTVAACSSPLPPAPRPASTGARHLSMLPIPEQDDFEAWYAAQVHAASQAPPPQPLSVGFSSRSAPPRPNKRAASNSDPSRAKRSRPATWTSQAGMSSSNNSSAEHWDILGDDFVSLCLDLLRGNADMASVNETVIVLILKVDKPTSMWQLRPISLCTGRAITDNILVAHELVHTLHTSVSRSSQGAIFKLDMEKAFDRVEWPFLKVVMLRLGFTQSWVDLIMRCVSSVSSRVRMHGTLSEAFPPSVASAKVTRSPLSSFSSTLKGSRLLSLWPSVRIAFPVSAPNKYAAFGRYRDKMGTRVSKWSNLLLFFSGREVLIKSIAQALPQYVMSCYLLPCSLVEEMSRSISRFWWSGKGSARGWPFLEVPISSDRADTLIWGDHDSGLYTVCSGYLFLRRPSSPLVRPPRLWKILAKLPAVSKVHSFAWRCRQDALPVGSRLQDAELSDGACPLCGARLEDTLHALCDCPDSSLALRQAGFADSLLSTDQASAVDWLGFATSILSQRSLALLLTLLWGLWRRRNTWVHERTLYPLHLVVESAISLCHDYASAFAPQTPPTDVAPTTAAPPRRRPSPTGSVKINVDGAFLPSARLGAIGVLAHDSSGVVLGGFTRPVPVVGPASAVEVSALLTGLEYAIALGWASALVESDDAVLVNKLHRPTLDLSLLGGLLAPSRNLVATSRGCLCVGFAPRSTNSAAHTLASWACQHNDVISFTSVCPELISRIVLDDLSSSF
ncbi:hypothetical protein GQ457_18G009450 [Hibiscus cannabinus]